MYIDRYRTYVEVCYAIASDAPTAGVELASSHSCPCVDIRGLENDVNLFAVTKVLLDYSATDLRAFQPASSDSIEKQRGSLGHDYSNRYKAMRPMSDGVHRSVC